MIELNDEIILADFENQIIENFTMTSWAISFISMIFIFAIVSAMYKMLREKLGIRSWKNIVIVEIAILLVILSLQWFSITIAQNYYKQYINKHPDEVDWTISIEKIYNKEKTVHHRRSSNYYLYLNKQQEKSSNSENSRNIINVNQDLYNNVEIGDKMYVIRNKKNKIILVYDINKYKYVNDEQLKIN